MPHAQSPCEALLCCLTKTRNKSHQPIPSRQSAFRHTTMTLGGSATFQNASNGHFGERFCPCTPCVHTGTTIHRDSTARNGIPTDSHSQSRCSYSLEMHQSQSSQMRPGTSRPQRRPQRRDLQAMAKRICHEVAATTSAVISQLLLMDSRTLLGGKWFPNTHPSTSQAYLIRHMCKQQASATMR